MAQPKFRSPFPAMELGYEDKKELARISKRVVGEAIESYEQYLFQDQEQLSPSRWVSLKVRDDVRVYHEKTPRVSGERRDVESLLTVGSVVGSLDDAMYGLINHTTDAMRLKIAYTQEYPGLLNCAVLATIQEPKYDKPFRSMTVKWLAKTLPIPVRALMKPRDVVFVEATGMMRLPHNGERIGFHLVHSVDHLHQARPLPMFVRATKSMCAIWRQQGPDRVQVYVRSFVETPDRLVASMTLKATADSLVTVWRNMHCAQMKKLAWLLRRQIPSNGDGKMDRKPSSSSTAPSGERCVVCTSKSKSFCVACSRAVCSKCRVKRELWAIADDGDIMKEREVSFCVPCLTTAIRMTAADVARDEMPDSGSLSDDLVKDPGSTKSHYRATKGPHSRPQRDSRQSGSSSTSSELTQDTYSRSSSRPNIYVSGP